MEKGERYGTIICDLESHRPVALLPGRDVQTVSDWISRHPTIQVVARDGSFEFREAIRIADEEILQVSDRWHLFHNLGKKVEEILKRHLPAVLRISLPGKKQGEQERVLSLAESRKWELIQRVQNDSREGIPLNVLARRYHLDPKTCRRYLAMSGPPSNRGWHRPHSAERFRREVERWVREGRTSEWMHQQLKGLGYDRAISTFRPFVVKLREAIPHMVSIKRITIRRMIWKEEEETLFQHAKDAFPFLQVLRQAVMAFKSLFQPLTTSKEVEEWCAVAEAADDPSMNAFAFYIRSDLGAIHRGMTMAWSNAQVEGQVNRLKTIKRQMYGRAGLDLLGLKILARF